MTERIVLTPDTPSYAVIPCPPCGGTGRVSTFGSSRPCSDCASTGRLRLSPSGSTAPDTDQPDPE